MVRSRPLITLLAVVGTLIAGHARCEASPITEISFSVSYKGDPPTSYLWSSNDSQVAAFAYHNVNLPQDTSLFAFSRTVGTNYAIVTLSTQQVSGQPLVVGTFTGAERNAFASPGHPGFDLDFNNQGFNQLFGSFTVLNGVFDTSLPQPRVVSFAATFDIQGDASHIVGHVYYNYSPDAVAAPDLGSGLLLGLCLLGLGGYVSRQGAGPRLRA